MKKIAYLLSVFFLMNCSNFEEDIQLQTTPVPFSDIETTLPLINIITEEAEFSNMLEKVDEEIEIAGTFNLFREGHLVVNNQAVELTVKGGFSTKFDLKSLGVKFEKKYDNSDRSLINPKQILPRHSLDKIKAIRLRNSGSDFKNTMLKDLSMTQLAINAGLDLDLTYGEPTLVYINENFYGLMNLRTEANTHGMAGLYGVKKKEVTLAKITTREFIKKDGDFDRIDAFVKAIEAQDVEYIKSELDLHNFIDYMLFESYIGNTDWPHNNARFYAIKTGKFRFVLFDLDKVAWLSMDKSPLQIISKGLRSNLLRDLFEVLYEEESFQQAFWDRYHDLLASGTIATDEFRTIVEENAQEIRPVLPMQISKYNAPESLTRWTIELDKLVTLFEEREQVVRASME